MNKEEFIKHLAKKHRRSQTHYRIALPEILEGLKEQLTDGKEIHLLGFGRFYQGVTLLEMFAQEECNRWNGW
jgi:nucleoid DNA-binding protein